MRAALALLVILAADSVAAGTLFKCVGADGVTVYQQTACAGPQRDAGVRTFQREPDAPHTGWAGQQAARDQAAAADFATNAPAMVQPAAPRRRAPSINPMSAEAELMRRAEHRSRTADGRALNRALYGASEPRRSPRALPPPAVLPPQGPTTVTDQHGNRYQQPPGSVFVTDERTGRQCFKNGDFLHCQ